MSDIDLDRMRTHWQQQGQRAQDKLLLDTERLRNVLSHRTTSAFRRHLHWLLLGIAAGAVTLAALLVFVAAHRYDALYLAAALPLLCLAGAELGVDVLQWWSLRRLDLSAPIHAVQGVLERVRSRRLRMVKWILLSAVLLWLPLVVVLVKGLLGVDLLRKLPASVTAANVLLGIVLIPAGLLMLRRLAPRVHRAPALQSLLDDASGASFSAAQGHWLSQARFDEQLQLRPNDTAAIERHEAWPAEADDALRAARRRVLAGVLFYGCLVLATGLFNASHGGNAVVLASGLMLHLLWLSQMLIGLLHRRVLAQTGASAIVDIERQADALEQMIGWRRRVARAGWVAMPLLVVAAAVVLSGAIAGMDLARAAGGPLSIFVATLAAALSTWCYRTTRNVESPPAADAMSFGALRASRTLVDVLRSAARRASTGRSAVTRSRARTGSSTR